MENSDPKTFEGIYTAARYTVLLPDSALVLRVNECCSDLDNLLHSSGINQAAFITAHNPQSKLMSAADNDIRNNQLENRLKDLDLMYFPGIGDCDDGSWTPEASFFVLGISLEDSMKLARE